MTQMKSFLGWNSLKISRYGLHIFIGKGMSNPFHHAAFWLLIGSLEHAQLLDEIVRMLIC